MNRTLSECLWVAMTGGLLALGANALHPSGLQLGRDHFPAPVDPDPPVDPLPGATAAANADDPIGRRLASKGLRSIPHDELVALVEDPLFALGAYLLVDARREESFLAGRLPAAVHFDPFYPERHINALLPLLPSAQRIIVYCAGGECEDSESAALLLLQFGAHAERLAVYAGGVAAWTAAGRALEGGPP